MTHRHRRPPGLAPTALDFAADCPKGGSVALDFSGSCNRGGSALHPERFRVVSPPGHGSVFLYTDGTGSYSHDNTAPAGDRFAYTATDANGNTSEPATVTIRVAGVGPEPGEG